MVRLKHVLVMFFVTFNLPDIVFTHLIGNLEDCLPSVDVQVLMIVIQDSLSMAVLSQGQQSSCKELNISTVLLMSYISSWKHYQFQFGPFLYVNLTALSLGVRLDYSSVLHQVLT